VKARLLFTTDFPLLEQSGVLYSIQRSNIHYYIGIIFKITSTYTILFI